MLDASSSQQRRGDSHQELWDECLIGEIFSLKEAQIVIEQWRQEYNTRRPHSAPGYRASAPGTYRVCMKISISTGCHLLTMRLTPFAVTKSRISKSCGNCIFSSFHTASSAPEVNFNICRCVLLRLDYASGRRALRRGVGIPLTEINIVFSLTLQGGQC